MARNGVVEPYYGEDVFGWRGRIRRIEKMVEGAVRFEIEWDSATIKGMSEENIRKETVSNVEIIMKEWIETAKEIGREIPKPKGRLMYA